MDVELLDAPASSFDEAGDLAGPPAGPEDWFRYVPLPDGTDYLRWTGLFEFVVSPDGTKIEGHALSRATTESFQTYLLNQVLSFALLKRGMEPLHATAVVVDGRAVAFAASPGMGKSTMAAAFLERGYPLLTDDLLVVRDERGEFVAQPSMPRIKLMPEIARALLGTLAEGVPMNPDTPKLVIPLGPGRSHEDPAPLSAVYALQETRGTTNRVTIRRLSSRRAFLELTRNTFNPVPAGSGRLKRHFGLATALAARVPVKSVSYPRDLDAIEAVRDRILADISR